MADYKNIPLGLRTQTQIPLDVKEYIQNESLLSNLGVNGQLAYTYTKGLVVYCIEESTRWEWTEVKPGLEDTGLINQDFIYSDNHIAFGIDYSNKRYNFFPYNQSTFTVPDATTTIKGILKLANDLGGTADAPTTPTAIHKTGNETFTGTKSATNTANTAFGVNSGISLINAGSNNNGAVFKLVNNTGSQRGISIDNQGIYGVELKSNGAVGMYVDHLSTSTAISIDQSTTTTGTSLGIAREGGGKAIFINDLSNTGTGDVIVYAKGNANTTLFKLSDDGSITANSYIKTGGTSTQMLMADGSVKENQDNLQKVITTSTVILDTDNNHTIFINNGATPITITIDSSITLPNFCVGFVQEGTGDVTFVGTGVSLTNPVGLKSKGQGYATFIERKLNTSNYFSLGDTKA